MNIMRLVDTASEPELSMVGLVVREGWNEKLSQDLVDVSGQSHIVRYTPNDSKKRFCNSKTADEWYTAKSHTVYSLYKKDMLVGVIWFRPGEEPESGAHYSFAIRLYEGALGRGLAYPFMKIAHRDYSTKVEDFIVWLETDVDNEKALRLYGKFGYEKVDETNGRVRMVYRS